MYKHTQTGWMVIGGLIAGILSIAAAGVYFKPRPETWFPLSLTMGLLAVMVLLFGWLTVTVDHEAVRIRFGVGLVRKTIPIGAIREAVRVRNKWYYGWGLRIGPWGPLYNVSGLDAVEIVSRDDSRVRVGTDEPDALVNAIRMRIST
jgi:hypothetical protein